MTNHSSRIDIYTDGACLGNPGPGGWAALIKYPGNVQELSGSEPNTTNNRMELMAAIAALEFIEPRERIQIFTDSRYLEQGITVWIHSWITSGWRTAQKKPVKNQDLWMRLQQTLTRHDVVWGWVKAHNNHPDNERVDRLARASAEKVRLKA